jgi:hypothetical protein
MDQWEDDMSIERKIRIMVAATVVFMSLTIIFCWGASGVNTINKNTKTNIEQLKGG